MKIPKLKKFLKDNLLVITLVVLLLPFYALVYKLYIPHVNAFGCFDDCFNYLGGYFISAEKLPYQDFFFNHQLIPPYISYFIQELSNPINIFDLVLRHKQFVIFWSFLFSIFLVFRFRLKAFLFVIIFELSKYYLFGDHFLAEPLIVYPLVYLAGVAMEKVINKKLAASDYFLVSVLAWFVIFSREPYIPLAIFILAVIFWGKFNKVKYTSVGIFTALTLLTFSFFRFNFSEYWFNLVTFNFIAVIPGDATGNMWGPKIFHVFLYPIYSLLYTKDTIFRALLIGINLAFLINFVYLLVKKQYKLALLICIFLGLANLRTVTPATVFYEAYRTLIWFALLLFTTLYLTLKHKNKKLLILCSVLIAGSFILFLTNKNYFGFEKVNQQEEFLTNYGTLLQEGSVINAISSPSQKFFVDGSDDLTIWQAKRLSDYKYVWYTSQMPAFEKYTDARVEMFKNNPPEFYREFGTCPKKVEIGNTYRLPDFVANDYVQLYNLDKPSCLFVRKDIVDQISDKQWAKAKEFLYGLPTGTEEN